MSIISTIVEYLGINIQEDNFKLISKVSNMMDSIGVKETIFLYEKNHVDFSKLVMCGNDNNIIEESVFININGVEHLFGKYYVTNINLYISIVKNITVLEGGESNNDIKISISPDNLIQEINKIISFKKCCLQDIREMRNETNTKVSCKNAISYGKEKTYI